MGKLDLTFVHSGLSAGSAHIYRVRAHVGGTYGKWTYRVLKTASREPTLETLATPIEPQRDSSGKYTPNQNLTRCDASAQGRSSRGAFAQRRAGVAARSM